MREAAAETRVPYDTIKYSVYRGLLSSRKVKGQRLVDLDEVLEFYKPEWSDMKKIIWMLRATGEEVKVHSGTIEHKGRRFSFGKGGILERVRMFIDGRWETL
jgi:hypothetical protein